MTLARIVLSSLLVVLGGPAMAQGTSEPEPRDYVFVFITTGERTDLTPEDRQEAFSGHFGNMRRMSETGDLLIAGPLGEPKSDPNHRGLFVFDETDRDRGLALANTDPTVEMGVFVMTAFVMTTDEPLTALLELDRAAIAKLGENPPPGANARAYTLATAPFDVELYEKAGKAEGVLIAARLHGSGEDESDEILLWLDAENEEAAKKVTGSLEGDWTLHGWYGSKSVAELHHQN